MKVDELSISCILIKNKLIVMLIKLISLLFNLIDQDVTISFHFSFVLLNTSSFDENPDFEVIFSNMWKLVYKELSVVTGGLFYSHLYVRNVILFILAMRRKKYFLDS